MSSNEIITLQFGNYSNHVGTHYWNFHNKRMLEHEYQLEDDQSYVSKLFRESQTARSKFVPRVMCFDIKTKLQALKQSGSFERDHVNGNDVEMTDENVVKYSESSIHKNEFVKQVISGELEEGKKVTFDFEGEVKTWSDYMTFELDDHSIHLLNETYEDGDDFTYFGLGEKEYEALRDEFEHNLHYWSEECDHMEGFQLIGDLHNGYCGLQAKVLEHVVDEYNKKTKLNFHNWALCKEGLDEKDFVYQYLNVALTLQSMKEYSSLSVIQSLEKELFSKQQTCIQIPNVQLKNDLVYHTSALLAAAIDSSTIPLYQANTPMHLSELCFRTSLGKWKLAGTSFGVPFLGSVAEDTTLFDLFLSSKKLYGNLSTSLFPIASEILPTSQVLVCQNLPSDRVCPTHIDGEVLQGLGLNRNVFNGNPYSVLEFFTEKYYPCETTATKLCYSSDKLRVEPPFPAILNEPMNSEQNVDSDVTTMSSIFTAPCFYELISEIVHSVKKMNLNKLHIVQEFGLDKDMLSELTEDLIQIAQTYNHDRAFQELAE